MKAEMLDGISAALERKFQSDAKERNMFPTQNQFPEVQH